MKILKIIVILFIFIFFMVNSNANEIYQEESEVDEINRNKFIVDLRVIIIRIL